MIVWFFFPGIKRKDSLGTYHRIRAQITKAHFNKQNGFAINEPGLTIEDLSCFRAPMYRFSFSARSELCIFWDFDKMTEEIGSNPSGENAPKDEGIQSS